VSGEGHPSLGQAERLISSSALSIRPFEGCPSPDIETAAYCAGVSSVRLDLEYDGRGFRGWASQPGLRTVQGELETALGTVLRAPVQLTVAGRTDTGVHALGQVASFETKAELPPDLARSLNGVGPDDIAVTAATVVAAGFDARRDARARAYVYRLEARRAPSPFERGRALWWPHRIDREALDACAAALPGNHDFTAFTPTQTDHVRFDRDILKAAWTEEGDILSFRIEADAFMRNMVRALVGTQLEVASGRRTVENFKALLGGAPRKEGGDTAPPHGLYLESVRY
jgi:tRNA pseudouridine38-40 synthase